jgi:hypothetical protein
MELRFLQSGVFPLLKTLLHEGKRPYYEKKKKKIIDPGKKILGEISGVVNSDVQPRLPRRHFQMS